MAWSPVAHRYCTAYARHGRHARACAISALGASGNPRSRAAYRMPRSLATKASGSPSARIAIDSTVHGPIPGSAASCSRALSQSLPAPRSISPAASVAISVVSVVRRDFGNASVSGSSPASASMVGNRWVSPPAGSSIGSPCASTSRCACVRAAAVDTCCPSTARTANSSPSTVRGTRRPGAFSISGASTGSVRSRSSTAIGSASRSSIRRHRLIAIARSRRSVSDSWQAMWSGIGLSATTPWPCGSRRVRR